MPERWGIPIRVVSEPSTGWLNAPIVNVLFGFLLGLCADPLKQRWNRWRATIQIYRELGAYVARFVLLQHKTAETGLAGTEFDIEAWQELTRPRLPIFDHFNMREPAVFLWVANAANLQELVGRLRFTGVTFRSSDQMPFQHPDEHVFRAFCFDVTSWLKQFCSDDLSRKRLTKEFNRHREAKAVGFPVAPVAHPARH